MNILFLNSLDKDKWGGGEKWMIHAGSGLLKKGHHVTIACLPDSVIEQKSKELKLSTWKYHIPMDIAFWKVNPLKKFLIRNKVDVLICCQNKDIRVGARAARQVGVKAIFARQGAPNVTNKKKYIKPFTQFIDGIITNTNSIKNLYERYGWFPKNFIHVIYNGVTIPSEVNGVDLHKKFNLSMDTKIIFSSGRLDWQKGFDLLVDVAKKAKKQHLKWFFIIAGKGKLKNQLENKARDNGVNDIVKFIGFSDEVQELLQSSDIFVLPSRYEGMPNALLEAMAIGKASVATNVNGAPELAIDGKTGFLVESEDSNGIFQRIFQVLSDDELRSSMETNALQRVKESFTFEKMTSNLESLFMKTISREVH